MKLLPGLVLLFVLFLCNSALHAQIRRIPDKPIPQIPNVLKPQEVIRADTMQHPANMLVDSLPGGSRLNEYPYTWQQDTTFYRALRLKISPSARFAIDAERAWANITIFRQGLQESPWHTAMRNMTLRADALRPDPVEVANRQIAIENAMDAGLYRPNATQQLSATFEQIGTVLGLVEDTSPTLSYSVKQTSTVTVVVYSTAATVVATILKKVQQPGSFSVVWNLRDDKGHEMPDGDYVLEARVGDTQVFRKHVVIGSKP